ncbi:hypothetical protein Y032_0477g2184 [Ancylostoma ceylanicum]|uniref:Uncharacterized protein n=1 Tax=Ancylostoma ceylanicum TaxID=53326 RepID=A0A016WWE6_9BILA|nr:hypothetical protein Y032_0477g2184 [Ancylostoma ceylanicum]
MKVERKIEDGKYVVCLWSLSQWILYVLTASLVLNFACSRHEISADMEQLEKEVQKLITAFKKALQRKQAERPTTLSESDIETA